MGDRVYRLQAELGHARNCQEDAWREGYTRTRKANHFHSSIASFCAWAIENQNIDVLTDDTALAKATLAECGSGRASSALTDYFGRLNMTAYFLSSVLNVGFIDCIAIRDRIEYHARDTRPDETNDLLSRKSGQRDAPDQDSSMLFVIQASPDSMGAERGPAIRDLKRSDTSGVAFALMRFVSLVVQDGIAPAGSKLGQV